MQVHDVSDSKGLEPSWASNKEDPFGLGIAVASAGACLHALSFVGVLSDWFSYVLLTFLLLLYLHLEVRRVRRVHPERWLLNPATLCSVMTFALGYGITNFIYFLPVETLEAVGLTPDISSAMSKLTFLALLAAVAMWLGYWSRLGDRLSYPASIERFQRRWLPATNELKPLVIVVLAGTSISARLLAVSWGIYGYNTTYERLIEAAAFSQYLALATSLGKLALVLAALQHFAPVKRNQFVSWLYILFPIEVTLGFLSGFKWAVVSPFVVVGLCYYLRRGRLSLRWFGVTLVTLLVAFVIIQPFRSLRNEQMGASDTSIFAISSTLLEASQHAVSSGEGDLGMVPPTIASRLNMTYIGSYGIELVDDNVTLPSGSPEFLKSILMAPIYAWVPRFLWEDKPLGDLGLWYTRVVLGLTHYSSTAMGPITYLYFAGGTFAVIAAFYVIGVMHRAMLFWLAPATSIPGGAIFLQLLATLSTVDSSIDGIVGILCRELPLLVVLLKFSFNSRPSRDAEPSVAGLTP